MTVRRALTLVTIASLLSIAAAPAYGASTSVRSSFKRAGTAAGVVTNGRYVLIEPGGGKAPTLLDEQTRRRVTLPVCATPHGLGHGLLSGGFEGPYLEWVNCTASAPTLDLYTLATGALATIKVANVAGCDPASSPCTEEPGPAGRYWYVVNAFSPRCNCAGTYIVNRQTGQTADPTQGPVDLNSPGLHRTLDSPLEQSNHAEVLIFGGDYGFSGSGVEEQFGEYAYGFQNSGASLGGFAIDPFQAYSNYLLRAHSTLRRRLSAEHFTGNRNAIILYSWGDTQLRGLLLPSLRGFTIPLPAALRAALHQDPRTTFVLSNNTLWAVTGSHQVWTAPAPK